MQKTEYNLLVRTSGLLQQNVNPSSLQRIDYRYLMINSLFDDVSQYA